MAVTAVKYLVGLAAVLTAAGCLQPPDMGTASYGYGPQAPVYQQPAYQGPAYGYVSPTVPDRPPHHLPPIYQPPPLSPSMTPETVRIPAVGHSPNPEGRYLPPPEPSRSLLTPAPAPSTSLFGPQRPGWN